MLVKALVLCLFLGVIFAEKCEDKTGCTCCDKHFESYGDKKCEELCKDLA